MTTFLYDNTTNRALNYYVRHLYYTGTTSDMTSMHAASFDARQFGTPAASDYVISVSASFE